MSSTVNRSRWGLDSSVRCRKVPVGPVKVPTCSRSQLRARVGQVSAGARVSTTRTRSSASQQSTHVRADAVLEPVIDRAQVQDLFHVPPAAFDLEELLVAQRDVLGGQVRVASCAAGTSRPGSPAVILALSMRSSPPGVTRRNRFRPWAWWKISPRNSARFVAGRLSEPSISS